MPGGMRKVEAFYQGCGRRRIPTTCPPFLDRRALVAISHSLAEFVQVGELQDCFAGCC
jgi:hypothetical protein